MGEVTTGGNRLFGRTTMARASELRRQALVGVSEINEHIPNDSDFPRTVDVVRREVATAGQPSRGLAPTFTTVEGLTGLVAHVRTNGKWVDQETGKRILLGDAERVVMIMDLPAGGSGPADVLLLTDRLAFSDPLKGENSVWEVREVYSSERDGIVVARVEFARED